MSFGYLHQTNVIIKERDRYSRPLFALFEKMTV